MPDFSHFLLKRRMAFSKDSSSLTWTRGTDTHPLTREIQRSAILEKGAPGCQRDHWYPQSREELRYPAVPPAGFTNRVSTPIMPEVTDSEATDRAKLLETEIERRLAERFAALRDEFDRLRMESDRRWFGFLEKFNQDLKGVVPAELVASAAPRAAGASRAG